MICRKCGPKDDSEFYESNRTECKVCVRARANKYRADNLDRVRSYDRHRGKLPHRKALVRRVYERRRALGIPQAASKAWELRNPEKKKASTAVHNALRDGRLTKGPCERCGTTIRVQGHHHDYSKPLDVHWLCIPCHEFQHHYVSVLYRFLLNIARKTFASYDDAFEAAL